MPIRPKSFIPAGAKQAREQQRRFKEAARGTRQQRGYGSRWERESKAYLQRHPMCRHCERKGLLVVANCVDHTIPHRGDPILFWDQNNWQGLCTSCHSRKTATEDGGFGNARRGTLSSKPD